MDYQGYKLLDKIMLVCRDKATYENSHGVNESSCYQAYLVDPSNKKQLESARYWAKWTEYGSYLKNEDTGKGEWEYEIRHEPVEFTFNNNGFGLELKDCAGGSSQGGKLSFWNCFVTKEDKTFMIGINSEMLLDLLKNATFVNGKCQSSLIFITQKGKVGMTVEGSETYKQCVQDKEFLSTFKSSQTSKFSFGDKVSTVTIDEVYLGTITKYYEFDPSKKNTSSYYMNYLDPRGCTLTKLKNPITYHLFDRLHNDKTLTELLNDYDKIYFWYYNDNIKKTCPKRTITGKITMDCTEEEFKCGIMNKIYDYEGFCKYIDEIPTYMGCDETAKLFEFLDRPTFGLGFKPFDLDSSLMKLITDAGIKYVEE